jgi:micrococcal nuclease
LAASLTTTVVSLLDGDTLQVLHHQESASIRLSSIDCPENGHAFGKRAQQAASGLAFRKDVIAQIHGHDKYSRKIAEVALPDGMSLSQKLVKQGWYWWYKKYAPRDTKLEGLEKEAREARKGLWADPQPVPPWEWRSYDCFSL